MKKIAYSYEHGDTSLPPLKNLVSDKEDLEKSRILTYLRMHCIITRPGIVYDEIDTERSIGTGNIYSDGTYYWSDVFANYVDRYNIPVPEEFRSHILANFSARIERHTLLRLVDCVEIQNNPYLGYCFNIFISKKGVFKYQNNTDCRDDVAMSISHDSVKYFIENNLSELFCYDSGNHGQAILDGYHWKIIFYKADKIINVIEGWPGEDPQRYREFRRIIEFLERYVPRNLGLEYMQDE
ncbi:MAG: hypothetical protein KBS83_02450 [Lachnospiraceae bacterium]|nr:hypothetical protein [Candidatus Equihabitans merdae]